MSAARLARAITCCVTSPGKEDDDVTDSDSTHLSRRQRRGCCACCRRKRSSADGQQLKKKKKKKSKGRAVDDLNWTPEIDYLTYSKASEYLEFCDFYDSDLVCCCERCDSISGWFPALDRRRPSLRMRNCMLACEVDRTVTGLGQRKVKSDDSEVDARMSVSLLSCDDVKDVDLLTGHCMQPCLTSADSHAVDFLSSWWPDGEKTRCFRPPPNRTIGHVYVAAAAALRCHLDGCSSPCPTDLASNPSDDVEPSSESLCCPALTLAGSAAGLRHRQRHETTSSSSTNGCSCDRELNKR